MGSERIKCIHEIASEKVWDSGHWHVAPLTEVHTDNLVIEFRRRKFKDMYFWVSAEAMEARQMKITALIRPEATAQPRQIAGISQSRTRTVRELPRCSAERVTRYYSDTSGSDFQCTQKARYEIEGTPLCSRHAGEAALAHMLQEGADQT